MILIDTRLHPLPETKILLVGSILLINIVTAHKCYVCGPNQADVNVESNSNIITSCDRFNNNISIFIRQCSPQAKACSFQTNGTIITRTCELFAINDCKKANNVEYCYCNTELCNKVHPTRLDDAGPEDLEEDEGSGTERDTNDLQEPTFTVTTSRNSNSFTLTPINISTLLTVHFVFKIFCDIFFI